MQPEKEVKHPVNESLKKAGYGAEEEYFFHMNAELIERNRRRLDDQRRMQETQEQKKAHWMICPKCGTQLKESDCYGVKADVCGSCSGLFLDKGELEQILSVHEPKAVSALVKKWLSDVTKPHDSGVQHFPV